ncbi:MAG: hypothetical protein H0U49_12295 [Parachlamydiaceae bacterium]|nr:hypothetical protein [Parachlamydiaceae bacterium]
MKKILLFVALLLGQVATAHGFDVAARIAYFQPQDHRIRGIYGHHGYPEYELEANCPIDSIYNCCGYDCGPTWAGWGNFSIYHKKGHSSGCIKNSSEITSWALNFGIKGYLGACCFPESFRPYLGFGVGYAHVDFHDHSPYVNKHIDRSGIAILAKSGIEYDITCDIFLDFFVDYASNWFNSPHTSRCCNSTRRFNTGGVKLGLGLGYHF